MTISTNMRLRYFHQPALPLDVARCICNAKPSPNSKVNIVMNFTFTNHATTGVAMASKPEVARDSFVAASRNS